MSEENTSTQDAPVEEIAPATIETVELVGFSDESRVAEDEAPFRERLSEWQRLTKRAIASAKSFTTAAKAMAQARAEARSVLIRANGHPDWSGDSDAYKRMVMVAEGHLNTLDGDTKQRVVNAVKQHVRRTFLLPAIVGHCLRTINGLGDELTVFMSGDEGRLQVLGNPSEALKKAVREQYRISGLNLPDGPFQHAEQSSAPKKDGEDTTGPGALSALRESLGGMANIAAKFAVLGILQAATAVSVKLLDGKLGEIEDRPKVAENLRRVAVIMGETATAIDPETQGKEDLASLDAAYFDPQQDNE